MLNQGVAKAQMSSDYVEFAGGLDTSSQRLSLPPGMLRISQNYLPLVTGGYRSIGGFERFNGLPRPSEARYTPVGTAAPLSVVVGDVLVNQNNGATGTVCGVADAYVALTKVTGTFALGHVLLKSGTPVGTVGPDTFSIDGPTDGVLLAAAANFYRSDISAPPGTGPVLGVLVLSGVVYAFRANVGGTGVAIHQASPTGWVNVPLLSEVSFTGGATVYAEGSTLTQGGVSATVRRVVLESGSWGSAGAGRLIITAPTGGNFTSGSATGGGSCTLSGPSTPIVLALGGRFRFDAGAIAGTQPRAYGCDGVNREFEFDGTVLAPINTGMGTRRAQCVRVHQKHLMLAYENSLQNSALGDPYRWSAIAGASEINALSRITNLLPLGGGDQAASLLVCAASRMLVLYGTSSADWKLVTLSIEAGSAADSAQEMSGGLVASDAGVRAVRSSDAFDNFAYELATDRINGYFSGRTIADSTLVKARGWYFVFFADGDGLVGGPYKKGMQWLPVRLGIPVRCVARGLIANVERHFFGSDDGRVYELESGTSFDGQPIERFLTTQPFTGKSPWTIKSWRHLAIEATGESAFSVRLQAFYEYGSPEHTDSDAMTRGLMQAGAVWDASRWDQSLWDGAASDKIIYRCYGVSSAIELNVYSRSATERPHTLHGASITFTPRRGGR